MIGTNWLESHEVILNCKTKFLRLVNDEGQRHVIAGLNHGVSLTFISFLHLQKNRFKGCNIYYILTLNENGLAEGLETFLVVREFADVFPEELPHMPSKELEFTIDLKSRTQPIKIIPYRMSTLEL
jgi:hypothetical protein